MYIYIYIYIYINLYIYFIYIYIYIYKFNSGVIFYKSEHATSLNLIQEAFFFLKTNETSGCDDISNKLLIMF